jgi:hypothetical protein
MTFGAPYILQKILSTVKYIKIMLVLAHSKLKEEQMSKLIAPIVKFVSLLNSELLFDEKA